MVEIIESDEFRGWIVGLRDRMAKARINARIRRLSLGNPGQFRNLDEGVSELKIDYGPGYRVYFRSAAPWWFCCCAGATSPRRRRTLPRPSAPCATGRTEP